MKEKAHITLTLNGERSEVAFAPHKTLLEVLREDLNLTGTKHGCELGECGTCAVLVDGKSILSCLMLGLDQAKAGNHLGDIANAIQHHAESQPGDVSGCAAPRRRCSRSRCRPSGQRSGSCRSGCSDRACSCGMSRPLYCSQHRPFAPKACRLLAKE